MTDYRCAPAVSMPGFSPVNLAWKVSLQAQAAVDQRWLKVRVSVIGGRTLSNMKRKGFCLESNSLGLHSGVATCEVGNLGQGT